MNTVFLSGNVGRDPEVRQTKSGISVANFSLATTEFYTKDGNREKSTEWHNLVWWRPNRAIDYIKKGTKILVRGAIRNTKWEAPDGETRYKTEIKVHELELLSSKPSGGGGRQPVDDDDDMPF